MGRYKITLNMPSRKGVIFVPATDDRRDDRKQGGGLVHQILCEHEAETLYDLMAQWRDDGFIIVMELYNQNDGSLRPNGEIALTDQLGAKVAYLTERDY